MQILLTNDDGIFAPGLAAIYQYLIKLGEVTVAAPAHGQSGAAHSITIHKPLICNKVKIKEQFEGYSVHGSPADCVKLAIIELHPNPFDLIVSGINSGANVGINVCYSGTVAAAVESAFFRIPAIALSLAMDEKMDFDKAARHCSKIIGKLLPLQPGNVINVNIPPQSLGKPKGTKVAPQSTIGFHEHYIRSKTEKGHTVFKLSGGRHRLEDGPSDTTSLVEGFITVTALQFDMTDYETTRRLEDIKW